MTFRVTELMTPNVMMFCSMGCGPTVVMDPTSFCTWITEEATGYEGRKAKSEEMLALLRADLRRAVAVH